MKRSQLLENVLAEERALAARRNVNRRLRAIRDERRALLAEDGAGGRKTKARAAGTVRGRKRGGKDGRGSTLETLHRDHQKRKRGVRASVAARAGGRKP